MDIARTRLLSQRLEGRPLKRPVDVVRWLVASQAQDFAGAKWALGLRTSGLDEVAVEKEFNEGAILRTHLLRPTWHFVTPADIRWLLALTAPRVHALNAPYYRKVGLNAATLSKATAVLGRSLEGGHELTRDELRDALGRAKIGTEDIRMTCILMHAELEALICSGARRGKQFTYALFDDRVPKTRPLSRDNALAELTGRYFKSRGPATVQDLAKWSGLTVADARKGLEAAKTSLRSKSVDGVTYWSDGSAPAKERGPVAHLLPIYDEYMSSYRDRSAICEPAFGKKLMAMGNALGNVFVVDGKIAGTWKRAIAKGKVDLKLTPFRKLSRAEQRAVAAATERYARFLNADGPRLKPP